MKFSKIKWCFTFWILIYKIASIYPKNYSNVGYLLKIISGVFERVEVYSVIQVELGGSNYCEIDISNLIAYDFRIVKTGQFYFCVCM